jgi:hypothetical protein
MKSRGNPSKPVMKRSFWLLLFLLAPLWAHAADDVFYVQVIRGSNDEKPPESQAKAVGPKMSQVLTPVFKWKYYWLVSEQEVTVASNKVSKLSVQVRDLEIQVMPEEQVEVKLFEKGKLMRTSRQKISPSAPLVMGGSPNDNNAWFIIVRKDKPQG